MAGPEVVNQLIKSKFDESIVNAFIKFIKLESVPIEL